MIPLVIDDAKLKALRTYAEEHPVPLTELREIIEGRKPCVGDREGYTIFLDFGFKLVYSIEEHPRTDGGTTWGRHMSVSLTEPTGQRVPSIVAVQLLAQALGFKPLNECYMRFEDKCTPKYVEVFSEIPENESNVQLATAQANTDPVGYEDGKG
jgi:hypothetical protein